MPATAPRLASNSRTRHARTGASVLVTVLIGAGCIDLFGVRGNTYDDAAYCSGVSPKPESCSEWCRSVRRTSGQVAPGCGPLVACLDLQCGTDQGASCGSCSGTDYCESGRCKPVCVGKTCGTDHGTTCGTCAAGSFCTTDGQCKGQTDCTGGKLICGQACVDPSSDAAHCGGCDRPCDGGPCQAGKCPRLLASGGDGGVRRLHVTSTHLYWMTEENLADGGRGFELRRVPHGGGPSKRSRSATLVPTIS